MKMYKVCMNCLSFGSVATTFIRADTKEDLHKKIKLFWQYFEDHHAYPLNSGELPDYKILSCSGDKGAFRTLIACSPPRTAVPSCELVVEVEVVETMRWCSPAPEASVFARLRHCDDLAAPFFCAVDPRSEQSTILLFATVLQFADQWMSPETFKLPRWSPSFKTYRPSLPGIPYQIPVRNHTSLFLLPFHVKFTPCWRSWDAIFWRVKSVRICLFFIIIKPRLPEDTLLSGCIQSLTLSYCNLLYLLLLLVILSFFSLRYGTVRNFFKTNSSSAFSLHFIIYTGTQWTALNKKQKPCKNIQKLIF